MYFMEIYWLFSSIVFRMSVPRRRISCGARFSLFLSIYWKSILVVVTPFILLPIILKNDIPVSILLNFNRFDIEPRTSLSSRQFRKFEGEISFLKFSSVRGNVVDLLPKPPTSVYFKACSALYEVNRLLHHRVIEI